MDKQDLEFQKRIQATFRIEAEEHIKTISANLIELEKAKSEQKIAEITELMFREFHSLKGAARSVDQKNIELVCQPMEGVFSALKRKEIVLNPLPFDLFYRVVDWLTKHLASLDVPQTSASRQAQQELISQLKEVILPKPAVEVKQAPSPVKKVEEVELRLRSALQAERVKRAEVPHLHGSEVKEAEAPKLGTWGVKTAEMVRIPISKLDPLLLEAEEMLQTKIAFDQRISELKVLSDDVSDWKTEKQQWQRRKEIAASVITDEWSEESDLELNKMENRLKEITRLIERDQHNLDLLVSNHLEAMKQVLMLPVSSLVETFPAMVREISRDQKKEVEFTMNGTELEIDKRILEELKDPLIHLLRNSIDHGINKPEERLKENKAEKGKINLAFAAAENGLFEISISDDGKGIDSDQVIKAAIKTGAVSKQASIQLEPKEIKNLIFKSGISTAAMITDISGHGLGLSIVHEKVLNLNGKISVESEKYQGTTFRILLPMTLATFRGIVVRENDFMFIIPTMNVERVLKVKKEQIKTVENHDTISIDNEILSIANLGEVLGLPEFNKSVREKAESDNSDQVRLVVLVSGDQRIAFRVNDLVDEQQVLVKNLGKLLLRVRNISGATIMGSGKVVPVLNIQDLMKSALKIKGNSKKQSTDKVKETKKYKILIAEDSITSRTLIKNILETAGYEVTTSVDGADGYSKARTGNYDIIVSDVDMPRMNGFEFTAKVKADKRLGETPVILLTSLESREDREHGIEVGADAYIVKSSFDQGNLLEVIKKLI